MRTMNMRFRLACATLAAFLASVLALWAANPAWAQGLPLERIRLPPGFEIGVFAQTVPNARSLALGANNVLFVGTRSAGRVYAIRYKDARATQVVTLASDLNMPNGVAFRNGALYVAEVDRILRFEQPPHQRHAEARMVDVGVAGDDDDVAGIPAERLHLLARHGQERSDAEALCPELAVGEERLRVLHRGQGCTLAWAIPPLPPGEGRGEGEYLSWLLLS